MQGPINRFSSFDDELEAARPERQPSPLQADASGRRVRTVIWLALALGLFAIWAIIAW